MTDPTGDRLLEFLQVMRQLRVECGWKASQTHRSLVRYLLEEAHETAEAIESGDAGHLREELGDLLLQIWFHAVIAEESGDFTLDDVVADIIAKMRRRNPHVFPPDPRSGTQVGRSGAQVGRSGAEVGRSGAEVERQLDPVTINEVWESIKAQEKQRTSPTDGLPNSLPALLYADKVLDRLAREARAGVVPTAAATSFDPAATSLGGSATSFDPAATSLGGSATSFDPAATSLGGSATSAEVGDRLLALVREAREAGVDPEQALRDAVRRLLSAT